MFMQTPLVSLSRDTDTGVFVLSLNAPAQNPENRWTLSMCRSVHTAFDIIEEQLEKDKPGTPAALCVNRKLRVEQMIHIRFASLSLHM